MPQLTRKEVEKRIANGEPLPDSVLVDYPDIARKYKIVKVNPADLKTTVKKHLKHDMKEYRGMIEDDERLMRKLNPSRYRKNGHGDLIRENPGTSRTEFKNFVSKRLEPPSHFDKRSFRTVVQKDGTEIIIGCPKGHYNAKTGRCKKGTRAQSIRTPKKGSGKRNPLELHIPHFANDADGNPIIKGNFYIDDGEKVKIIQLNSMGGVLAEYDNGVMYWANPSRLIPFQGNENKIVHHEPSRAYKKVLRREERERKGRGKSNPRHGNVAALKRGISKHLNESFSQFKSRMIKKHGHVADTKIKQWYNLRNAGAKALGLK